MPFTIHEDPKDLKPLEHYLDLAKTKLVQTVDSYKAAFGKSYVDQRLLIPEEYQELIWFLFPSQALSELRTSLTDKQVTYQSLVDLASPKSEEEEPFATIFKPRNYNLHSYEFGFTKEYMGVTGDVDD